MTFDFIKLKLIAILDYVTLPRFANRQFGLRIANPRRIGNPGRIHLGNQVRIGPNSILAACAEFRNGEIRRTYTPSIRIGNRVHATSALQIYCVQEVVIEDDVLIAANAFICDYAHGYANVEVPYWQQPYQNIAAIRIGKGSWLGQNVVVMPGVEIGQYCVIGAGSIVTKSIPDQCIAVGNPAKIIKKWCPDKKSWLSTNP